MVRKYSAHWNLEGYNIILEGIPVLREFIPSQSILVEYSEIPGYLGVTFIFDNIGKFLWINQVQDVKGKGWVKRFLKESSEKKLKEMTFKLFEQELKVDVTEYFFRRANNARVEFEKLFMYELAEYPLYTKHYFKPEFEQHAVEEQKEEVKESLNQSLNECPSCGWVVSKTAEVCPKCKNSLIKSEAPSKEIKK